MKITEKKYLRLKFFEWISLAINVILSYILISLGNGESISPLWIILGLFIAGQGLFKVPCSPRDPQESSLTPQFKSINFWRSALFIIKKN